VANDGIITLAASRVTGGSPAIDGVTGNHYRITFDTTALSSSPDPASLTVFAPTSDSGERDWPADPTPPAGLVFSGWFTGTGEQVEGSTVLGGLPGGQSTDGDQVLVATEAHYAPPSSSGGGSGGGAGSHTGSGSTSRSSAAGVVVETAAGEPLATPTPTPTTAPTGSPAPTASPQPQAAPEAGDSSAGELVWMWWVGGGVAVILLALLSFLLLRRRN
jgi:hypothetical protein